jgi:hypothetical protein
MNPDLKHWSIIFEYLFINKNTIQVCERLERLNTRGKCLTLKLMLRAENAPEQTAKFLGKNQLCFLKDRFLCETGRNVNPHLTTKLKNISYFY